jgi:hypothetical protein
MRIVGDPLRSRAGSCNAFGPLDGCTNRGEAVVTIVVGMMGLIMGAAAVLVLVLVAACDDAAASPFSLAPLALMP